MVFASFFTGCLLEGDLPGAGRLRLGGKLVPVGGELGDLSRFGDAVRYGDRVHLGELGDSLLDDGAVAQAGRGERLDVAGQLIVDPRTQLLGQAHATASSI
ncbi:hypothetical protein ABT169_21880 [Streptomyces sp. NPDC001616]|uniref:hypothetical protein n=1 Tax=Streptomyces sp. NPDC001616 TaxID=3156648 RepID=UPI00332064BC